MNNNLLSEGLYTLKWLPEVSINGFVELNYGSFRACIYRYIKQYRSRTNTFDLQGNLVCVAGKRRSLGDIYKILKHYRPEITLKDVIVALIKECEMAVLLE